MMDKLKVSIAVQKSLSELGEIEITVTTDYELPTGAKGFNNGIVQHWLLKDIDTIKWGHLEVLFEYSGSAYMYNESHSVEEIEQIIRNRIRYFHIKYTTFIKTHKKTQRYTNQDAL